MNEEISGNNRTKEIIKVSFRGIGVNLILVVFKAIVGFLANSIAVILDAVNNLSDALSSIITIIGTKIAGKAADKKHPYGHGRVEYVTSSIIAIIVLVAGVTSLKESVEKIIEPRETNFKFYSIIVIAAAVAAKILLGLYFRRKGKALNSSSLATSGTDALFDAILSAATLVSAVVAMVWEINIEGFLGVGISVFILKAGIEVMREAINNLIGVRIDAELAEGIKGKINSFEEVHGAYDLILHTYGPGQLIGSVHVELDDGMTAREIDTLTRRITADVYRAFGVILTVGIYATNTSDDVSREIREAAKREVSAFPQIMQMHGFYMEHQAMVVSLDIIVDFKEPDPKAIADTICAHLSEQFPDYRFYINLDRDFSD
ncbi:MAG: cation transporter [Clostridia bacterium]|nr:cation transporter [Clostridia bacterium]